MQFQDAWCCGAQVKTIAEEVGVAFLGIGFDPKWQVADVPIMPKDRYRRVPACVQQLLRFLRQQRGFG